MPILLLSMALSVFLIDRGREFQAGLCLAMGAAKPHLFLVLVLVILVRRWWRMAWGLGTGGVVIAAISFLTGGLSWPQTFWATIMGPAGSPHPETMINLHGLLYSRHIPAWVEAAFTIIILALVWRACLRAPARFAVALALAAGVLLGGHSYLYDLSFCIPLTLVRLASHRAPDWLKWCTAIFASPYMYLLPFVPAAIVLALFVVLVAIAFNRDETRPHRVELPAMTAA